jgi:outer membrane protein, heavy metal efflux system
MFVRRRWHGLMLAAAAMLLGGCATTQPERDVPQINKLLADRGAPTLGWDRAGDDRALVTGWLAEPLTADRAVRISMLRSPRLQAEYARLGLARADILEAVQIANPRLSLSTLALGGGSGSQFSIGIAMPLVDLLVLPSRSKLARAEFERAKLDIAATVLAVSFDVEQDWYDYVAAQQVADMRQAVATGLATSAELAKRFFDAGNISELQLKREEAAATEARIAAARAQVAARLARLKLNLAVGLSGKDADWQTSDRLPLPVEQEDDPAELMQIAGSGNLELLAARREADILAEVADIARSFRLIGGTEIGYERERETDGSVIRGPSINLELPIFNQGGAKVARAEAHVQQARARLAELQLKTDAAVKFGSERVRVLADIVRTHRDALIPARETIVARSQQQQNFMLIGVFELIQAKTQEYDAYQAYLEAIRDYWVARLDLMRAIGARLPSERQAQSLAPGASEILAKKDAPMDHSAHGGAAPPTAETPPPAAHHHHGEPK